MTSLFCEDDENEALPRLSVNNAYAARLQVGRPPCTHCFAMHL